jgi:pyruvate formate lyase activating enzyme
LNVRTPSAIDAVEAADASGVVFNIMRFCVHDGPGIRTTVFLKGCPLRCFWCHNPESQDPDPRLVLRTDRCLQCGSCLDVCPEGAIIERGGKIETLSVRCKQCGTCAKSCPSDAREIIGRTMTVEEVMAEVEKDAVFYEESGGGVTFSGGEPLAQHRFLLALLRASKERGYHTVVDTSGFASPAIIEEVSPLTDIFLYDLKSMDEEIHRKTTGVPLAPVLHNLRLLARQGKPVIARLPLIPGVNDGAANLEAVGELLASLSNIIAIQLLPFHATGAEKYARLGMPWPMDGASAPSTEQMNRCATTMARYHHAVSIGGSSP